MSYATESKKNVLQKHTLAMIDPSERVILWTLDSGAIYKRNTDYMVIDVRNDSTSLTEASSAALNAGEWYFDKPNKELFIRMGDDSNPANSFITLTYRLFFSTHSGILPYDLSPGSFEVDYCGCIKSVSPFSQGIDPQDQSGISLESSGNISFLLNSFWQSNFDKLFWENKNITIYSYLPESTESTKIFEGEVTDKTYSTRGVSFRVRDFVHKLSTPITANLYSSSDGDISDSVIGKPKRTIYGQVDGVRCQQLDQTLLGYDLTGTVGGTIGSAVMPGVGTSFLAECSPDDTISFTVNSVDLEFKIESVDSDTQITLSEESEIIFSGASATILPAIPYRAKNREFMVAGHKLREPTTTVSAIIDTNKIEVADVSDIFAGDTIVIDGNITRTVKRISGSRITTTQVFTASVSDSVSKAPISKAWFNSRELVVVRDWTPTNSTESKITLNSLAEFNQTLPKSVRGTSVAFTNGSRNIVGTATRFTTDLKIRDWVRSTDLNHTDWYEILDIVDDLNAIVRVAYAGTNFDGDTEKKNVTYINDESTVTVDTAGKENSSGIWVKTASDVVKDVLTNAGVTNLNTGSFATSKIEAPYIVSLALPLDRVGNLPTTKAVINLMNQSVFGSLVSRNDYTVAYDILSAERPSETEDIIGDDDILDFSVKSKSEVIQNINVRHSHQDADKITGESAFSVESYASDFVSNTIEVTKGKEIDLYLYESADTQTMAQRIVFINSLTQSVVELKGGGLYLADKEINDKLYFSFDHMYSRFGSASDQSKIGIISSIKKNGDKVDVSVSDLGNLFNRVAAISPNTASDFSSATASELVLNGFIVDNDTGVPGATEDELECNLIG